jgi:hypothetical protein
VAKSAGVANEVDYGFYDDVNTGMYRSAADTVRLVAGSITGVNVSVNTVDLRYAGATKISTTNTGVTVVGGIVLSGTGRIQGIDTVSAGTDAANKTYVDNAVAGVPVGDITGVTAGTGMTGGGTSGTVTLNVIGGDGITANADNITVDSTVVRTSGAQTISGI